MRIELYVAHGNEIMQYVQGFWGDFGNEQHLSHTYTYIYVCSLIADGERLSKWMRWLRDLCTVEKCGTILLQYFSYSANTTKCDSV